MAREYKDRKGVTRVRLFNEDWRVGRLIIKTEKQPHCVVYGPNREEFDVYGDDALRIYDRINPIPYYEDKPETVDKQFLKLYILTSILDVKDEWIFDMTKLPKNGKVKLVYPGITIKWAEFKDTWESVYIEKESTRMLGLNPKWLEIDKKGKQQSQFLWEPCIEYIKPIAWRKQS